MKGNMEPILKKYLERVIHDNRTVDSRGVMQVQRIIQLDLDEIYINLTAKLSGEKKGKLEWKDQEICKKRQ